MDGQRTLDTPGPPAAPGPRAAPRFAAGLAAVAAAGLVPRVLLAFPRRHVPLAGDAVYYSVQGRLLPRGEWFVQPLLFLAELRTVPSALHPPLFTSYLGVVSWFGIDTGFGHRLATCALGAGVIAAVGLAGRAIGGPRAGLFAAAAAAIYPPFVTLDRQVLSETMVAFVTALTLLAACTYRARPGPARAAVLGASVAFLTLARSETFMLFLLLAAPLVWIAARRDRRDLLRHAGAVVAAALVVLGPWIGFNLARFEEPVLLSTNGGLTLADSYCDATFYGPKTGWWSLRCLPSSLPGDESQRDRRLRELAAEYFWDHTRDLPRVMAARVGRVWQVYDPFGTAIFEVREGKKARWEGTAGTWGWWALALLGALGAREARRRDAALLPFGALVALVTLTALVFYGSLRFRVPAEVGLLVLAGLALDRFVPAARRRPIGPGAAAPGA